MNGYNYTQGNYKKPKSSIHKILKTLLWTWYRPPTDNEAEGFINDEVVEIMMRLHIDATYERSLCNYPDIQCYGS